MRGLLTAIALLLASGTAHAAAPDLTACPRLKLENTDRQRTQPVPIPQRMASLIRSDMGHFAISTLAGRTLCIDTQWIEETPNDFALSPDGRFLSFTWSGYESGGFIVVDRSGNGQEVETGAKPLFSPSGKRLAAVEISESGFGSLNGFAVWQVETAGLSEFARIEDSPYMTGAEGYPHFPEWRIDRWVGEDCIELVAQRMDRKSGNLSPVRFAATAKGGWKPAPAPNGCGAR